MTISRIKRRQFTRDLLLVFLLFSVAVLGSVAFFSSRAREDIAQKYIDNATVSAVHQFEAMVDAMTQSLELPEDWIASGRLSLGRADELNDLLFPVLKHERILYGISMADTLGKSYYLTTHGDGWRTRWIERIADQRQAVLRYWDTDHQQTSE